MPLSRTEYSAAAAEFLLSRGNAVHYSRNLVPLALAALGYLHVHEKLRVVLDALAECARDFPVSVMTFMSIAAVS